jgi:hypothetical protein
VDREILARACRRTSTSSDGLYDRNDRDRRHQTSGEQFCACETPFAVADPDPGMGCRCLICGKYEGPSAERSPGSPPNPLAGDPRCDPSPVSVPEQLRLDVDEPPTRRVVRR